MLTTFFQYIRKKTFKIQQFSNVYKWLTKIKFKKYIHLLLSFINCEFRLSE